MDDTRSDLDRALILDANAVAGLFEEIFGAEMTASPTACAHCGRTGEVGTLIAFIHAPGVVLRCPSCEHVMVRIARTPDAFLLDARGAVYLRVSKRRP